MTPDIPIPITPQGAPAPAGAVPPGEALPFAPGEIFAAVAGAAPPGAPPGAVQLSAGSLDILVQLRLELLPGEGVLAELVPRRGDEAPLIRILARSGEGSGKLELPSPGAIRLAPGAEIPPALRLLLGKGVLAGEVLPFANRLAAGVNLGGVALPFQLDPPARPGDRIFVRGQDGGGVFSLQVLGRGGPRASTPPAEGGLAAILRAGPFRAAPVSSQQVLQALQPGNVLEGVLLRVLPQAVPRASETPNPAFHGKPEASGRAAGQALPGGGREGVPPPVAAPARTALLRFPGFEMEVPWPQEASGAFSPGDPVRLWVRGTAPRLDLQLLPPAWGSRGGEGRWVPSGGAGERSFGPRLLQLAEGLAQLREAPGEEPALVREAGRLHAALERLVLREGELTPERVREAFETSLREPGRREADAPGRAPEEGSLRESLQRFLQAAREIGRNDPALASLGAGAGRAAASLDFLNAANALRQHVDQGSFLQIPYVLGGERGTMDVVVRGDRGAGKKGGRKENYSAVLLLELEGLGPLRVDASLARGRASVRFTTPSEPVGRFLNGELPKLREAIESQQIQVERVSWAQGKVTPEPAVPAPPEAAGPEGAAPFIDLKV
ncbi:MAG: flagellar hook-length control protein FliK [Candidatus Tectomicrobia bacterium]|uniref:Flagellar hook-length control protein FliK n=1 Tax=Tectimicrobiota bacterium TaxID=2528274 RepID=A0A932MNP6_UNCTE|nr:flagellar hook-length control protein FliK [Candidatus Tectomicrobia bacterium]